MNITSISSFQATIRAEHRAPPESSRDDSENILSKIWDVVQKILLGLANALFFLTNPALYSIAFLVGFFWNEHVQIIVDKVIYLWKNHAYIMAPMTIAAGLLSVEVTWAATAILFGAHLGAVLSTKAEEFMAQKDENSETGTIKKAFKLI